MPPALEFAFFDIGGTLGDRHATTGAFHVFPSSAAMLAQLRDVIGLRLGVITTLGDLTNAEGWAILQQAGLAAFLDPAGFISEHDVHEKGKPNTEIYRFAAAKVGVPIERCLFIGENLIEVIGARAAGMQTLLKPCPPGRELPH